MKAIDKAALSARFEKPDLSELRLPAMDEFAIRRGLRVATIFVEPERKQVLWVCRGRGRGFQPLFFKTEPGWLCHLSRAGIRAVAMDMNGAYEEEVKHQCPLASIL